MARNWYCENCRRVINSYGLARHRKMHHDRKESVRFRVGMWSYTYDYRETPDHENGGE
jgi:hypothetical protein